MSTRCSEEIWLAVNASLEFEPTKSCQLRPNLASSSGSRIQLPSGELLSLINGMIGIMRQLMGVLYYFRSYLCERPRDQSLGAHSRYHPDDLKSSECRGLMNEVKEKKSEEKERVFLAICRQFRPAFRYFFLEMFSDPSDWLTARMAYTRGESETTVYLV